MSYCDLLYILECTECGCEVKVTEREYKLALEAHGHNEAVCDDCLENLNILSEVQFSPHPRRLPLWGAEAEERESHTRMQKVAFNLGERNAP